MFPSGLDEDTYKAAHRENRPTTILAVDANAPAVIWKTFQIPKSRAENSQVKSKQSHQTQRPHPSSQKYFPGPHQSSFSNHSNWQLRRHQPVTPPLPASTWQALFLERVRHQEPLYNHSFSCCWDEIPEKHGVEGGLCLCLWFGRYDPAWQRRHGSRSVRQMVPLHLQPGSRASVL